METKQVNGFDWYLATESASSILNNLRSYYTQKIGLEKDKNVSNLEKINTMKLCLEEIRPILQQSDSFSDYLKMQTIIDKYAPALKAINLRASNS